MGKNHILKVFFAQLNFFTFPLTAFGKKTFRMDIPIDTVTD